MYIVLPVKTVLAYAAVGISSYSFLLFFASLTPLEIQFFCAILNVLTAGMTMCALFHYLPMITRRLERLERMLEMEVDSELKELAEAPVESMEPEETTEFAELLAAANINEKKAD